MWPAPSTTTLTQLREFYTVTDGVWQAFIEAAGDPGDDVKALAGLPPNLLTSCLTEARFASGESLSPIQASQVGLMFRAARRLLHVQAGGDLGNWVDPNPWEPPVAVGSTPTSPTATSTTLERKMKYTNVLDQGDESEFTILDDQVHATLMGNFILLTGGLPSTEEEPTREQLSALHRKVFLLNQPPYADFAVFTPYGKKFLKAMKYRTFLPTLEGGYIAREVPGPAAYSQWLGCFRVWKTAATMLKVIDLALLQRYEIHIENLVKLLPGCWHLIASADDRGRSEHMARLQLQVQMLANNGETTPKGWVKDRPSWGPIFKLLIEDQSYWQDNVNSPAMIWLAHGRKGHPKTPAEFLASTDVPGGVEALKTETEDVKGTYADASSPSRKQQANRDKRDARKKRLKSDREELVKLRTERSPGGKGKGKGKTEGGEQLCFSWNNNNGACAGLAPGSECKGKVKRVHKCTKCHSPGHPSCQCPGRDG